MNVDNKGRIIKTYTDEYIISLLEENKTTKKSINKIAEREGIAIGTLSYRAKKLGYSLSKRRQTLNENYFGNVDTELKAYFLGFIVADGCVNKTSKTNKNNNRLVINISTKDRIILEKFKEELNLTTDIDDYVPALSTYANYPMSRLCVNSQAICKSLLKYGVSDNKIGNEKLPNISEELIPHFIRGFFDGDGTATGGHVSFCACYNFAKALKEVFRNWGLDGALSIIKDKRKDNVYKISVFKQSDKEKFYSKVYKDATFYLNRKHNNLKQYGMS